MSFINPFKQPTPIPPNTLPQKLSLLYIQQSHFSRIQISQIQSLYKLSLKTKKPIILSLQSLPVLKYIADHSQIINLILQMENVYQIRVALDGYGVFNQKYQMDRVGGLFGVLGEYCQGGVVGVKRMGFGLSGWRAVSTQFITNLFQLIQKCQQLQQFSLSLNHIMHLPNLSSGSQQKSKIDPEEQDEEVTLYGRYLFQIQQFELLMKCISTLLPTSTLTRLQLRFGAWSCVNSTVLQILTAALQIIYKNFVNLKVVKLDLNGWGTGDYQLASSQIQVETVQHFFKSIQELDADGSELLEIDMRNWPAKYKIAKYKQRFLYLSGGKKREEGQQNMWTMTGTNFMGSQLKSKISSRMKIQIKD